MEIFTSILFALIALFILVTVHEFGHYWVARRCGVQVLRFSIGFGKPFLRFNWQGTEFALAPIPLGGYVKMFGDSDQDPVDPSEEHLSFNHKPVGQRMAIVAAGPIANFVLAILFYWLVFIGGMVGYAPLIDYVLEDSPAAHAGMPSAARLSDPLEIIAVDGAPTASWRDVFNAFVQRVGESGTLSLTVQGYAGSSPAQTYQLQIERWQGDTDNPMFLSSIGLVAYSPDLEPLIGSVVAGGVADRAGVQAGDRVVAIDGVPVQLWEDFRASIAERAGQPLSIRLDRNGVEQLVNLIPESLDVEGESVGRIGVGAAQAEWPAELRRPVNYSIIGAFVAGAQQTLATGELILDSLRKLVTGQISTKSLGGPITIAKFANASAEAGWQSFFMFVAALSVMLGVVNLLPIPVLDGGHLVFYAVEAVKGSPVADWIQAIATRVGVAVLMFVMILALYNDFARL